MRLVRVVEAVAVAVLSSCTTNVVITNTPDSGTGTGATCAESSECGASQECKDGGCVDTPASPPDGGTAPTLVSLEISPAALSCTLNTPASVQLTANGTFSDGSTAPVVAAWSIDRLELAVIDWQTGLLTASGQLGGSVKVTATSEALEASTTVAVTVTDTSMGPSTPASPWDYFGSLASDASRTPLIVYPDDQVMFPVNIAPPLIQWEGGGGNDLYRVRLIGQFATVVFYTTSTEFKPTSDQWRIIASGAGQSAVKLTIEATHTGEPTPRHFASTVIRLEFANSSFRGQIYYWVLNRGRLVRIGDDWQLDDFWQPPAPPGQSGQACVACHALSPDGHKLAFTFDEGNGWAGLVDVRTPEPNLIGRSVFRSNWTVFDSTGDFLVGVFNRQFTLYTSGGASLGPPFAGGAFPAAGAAMPRFSPDGKRFAYVEYPENSWEIDFGASDLYLLDTTHANSTISFTNKRKVDSGLTTPTGMAGLKALSYPSFSPDSKLLAYSRGEHSRSSRHTEPNNALDSQVMLLDAITPGSPVPLLRLGGGQRNYAPSFSPFTSGGVHWIAFMSRRDYGKVLKGKGTRQIWVAALDASPTPGVDPSHPPFWLPAQETETENMTGYWAPATCKSSSSDGACQADIDCCSGRVCRPGAAGKSYCTPVEQACRITGAPCTSDSQCCSGLVCKPAASGNTCQLSIN